MILQPRTAPCAHTTSLIGSVLLTATALLLFACGEDDAPQYDPNHPEEECPEGPQAPLGAACGAPGLLCAYGYEPIECGGRTVLCQDGVFVEESHTDPQPDCFEDTPDTECPDGPQAPLDEACEAPGLLCAYGYEPVECGGRTVLCQDGVFVEESHTDPQPDCVQE